MTQPTFEQRDPWPPIPIYVHGDDDHEGVSTFGGPIEVSVLVASVDARSEIRAVADYVCDGVADQEEINAAIAMLSATTIGDTKGGGVVQLSQGTFFVSDPINSGPNTQGIWLRGAGIYATRIETSADAAPLSNVVSIPSRATRISDMSVVIVNDGWTQCIDSYQQTDEHVGLIENVFVEHSSASYPGLWLMGMYLRNNTTVRNCVIGSSHQGDGIQVAGFNCVIDGVRIVRATTASTNSGHGIYALSSIASDLLVVNSTIDNCAGDGIYVGDDNNIIIGNRVSDGINIASVADGTVIGGNIGTVTNSGTNTVFLDNDTLVAADLSPLTSKGDLWGYDTADNRLPVGADAHVLTADSAEALGVKWVASSAIAGSKATTLMLGGM